MKPFSFLSLEITSLEGLVIFLLLMTLFYFITGLIAYCMLCYTHLLLKKVVAHKTSPNQRSCDCVQNQTPPMSCACGQQVKHDADAEAQDGIQRQHHSLSHPYEIASSIPPYGIRLAYNFIRILCCPFFLPPPAPWQKRHDQDNQSRNNSND